LQQRGPGRALRIPGRDSAEEDEDDGEDLLETAREDYKEMKELDQYDAADLDESEGLELPQEARVAAERELEKRDRARKSRAPRGLLDVGQDDDEEEDASGDERAERRRRRYESAADPAMRISIEPLDLASFNVPLREFLERFEVRGCRVRAD
jgi:hypothetical protein